MRAKSMAVHANDIIPYIMCISEQPGKPKPCMPEDVAEGKNAIGKPFLKNLFFF